MADNLRKLYKQAKKIDNTKRALYASNNVDAMDSGRVYVTSNLTMRADKIILGSVGKPIWQSGQ